MVLVSSPPLFRGPGDLQTMPGDKFDKSGCLKTPLTNPLLLHSPFIEKSITSPDDVIIFAFVLCLWTLFINPPWWIFQLQG